MAGTVPSDSRLPENLSPIAGRPIRAFPSADPSFKAAVIAAIGELRNDGSLPLERLEELLRSTFPGVRVVEQTDLGAAGGRAGIYIFRDGSVSPKPGDGPGTMRYVEPLEAVQRACVRNVLARERSAHLVGRAVLAVERSRTRRVTAPA